MATDHAVPSSPVVSAQLVGNAFTQQFYQVLHHSPEVVYRFYQEGSTIGRPDHDGVMSSVSTVNAINQKILEMNYSEFKAEINTVDAQDSMNNGVTVLVTGYLTGRDEVKKGFTQSFFLAPQDKGYFVLNDMFRYTEKGDYKQGNQDFPNGTSVSHVPEQVSPHPLEQEHTPAELAEVEEVVKEEVYNIESSPIVEQEKEVAVENLVDEIPIANQEVVANAIPVTTPQEDAPKRSYAAILKVMKDNRVPLSRPVPAVRPAPTQQQPQSVPAPRVAPAMAPATDMSASNTVVSESHVQETEADGYSVYVKGLPLNATAAQLEEEFKKFGPIKPGGIQVRSQKLQGFCFGFVEFEEANAVRSAVQASPVTIGGQQALVEEKRNSGPRVNNNNNRGRSAPSRGGGYRGDQPRGRGNYGGSRGYNNNRAEFGNRGGSGRGSSSNRRGDH